MKRIFTAAAGAAALVAVMVATAVAGGYRYIDQETFREWLQTGKQVMIIDIQEPVAFQKRHFRGSIGTAAFPAKTDEERRKLDPALASVRSGSGEVVIVCPRGGGGAKNTYDYLVGKGVAASRLYILEKGIDGWPYPELVVKGGARQ